MNQNPRLRHLPGGLRSKQNRLFQIPMYGEDEKYYEERHERFKNWVSTNFDPDAVTYSPQISAMHILELGKTSAINALGFLHNACGALHISHHLRIREYMVAGYAIAQKLQGDDEAIGWLSCFVTDGRSTKTIKEDMLKDNLLHYTFIYAFAQSRLVSRNRATQWANALQIYFDDKKSVDDVEVALMTYGQNRLRLAANRVSSHRAARQRGESGPTTMEEALADSVKGDAGKPAAVTDDGSDEVVGEALRAAGVRADTGGLQGSPSTETSGVDTGAKEITVPRDWWSALDGVKRDLQRSWIDQMIVHQVVSETAFDPDLKRELQEAAMNIAKDTFYTYSKLDALTK